MAFLYKHFQYQVFLHFRSNESKAYPQMMGDKVIEVYCHMTAVSTENGTCGNGGWTLVMKTDGNEVPSIMHVLSHEIKFT